jgi:hypothetical protein
MRLVLPDDPRPDPVRVGAALSDAPMQALARPASRASGGAKRAIDNRLQ